MSEASTSPRPRLTIHTYRESDGQPRFSVREILSLLRIRSSPISLGLHRINGLLVNSSDESGSKTTPAELIDDLFRVVRVIWTPEAMFQRSVLEAAVHNLCKHLICVSSLLDRPSRRGTWKLHTAAPFHDRFDLINVNSVHLSSFHENMDHVNIFEWNQILRYDLRKSITMRYLAPNTYNSVLPNMLCSKAVDVREENDVCFGLGIL
mmetsp:Transcript_18435/g.38607  ORF Transcript_18435/g.38607 Transcript_18435/m.38607 type:complete len:207 (+) Transcript_18435:544-1164(+)